MPGSTTRAGFSKVDITPPLGLWEVFGLGYWYRRSIRFTGVRDPLSVRAAAIGDGKDTQLLISVDSIFDSYGFVRDGMARIHSELGVPEENILVTCTHSHSTPVIGNNNTTRGSEYGTFVAVRLAEAAMQAYYNRQPLFPGIVRARVSDVVRNRRPILKNGQVAELHTPIATAEVADPGPVNDTLTLVTFRRQDGTLAGGLCHFGIHGVSIQCSDLISGDCMGRAIQQSEQSLGGQAVILHLNAPCGDIDPVAMGNADALDRMSKQLFAALQGAVRAPESPVNLAPQMSAGRRFPVARRKTRSATALRERAERIAAHPDNDVADRHHSGTGYELFLLQEEEAVGAMPAQIEIDYQLLRMGDLLWVGIGGEVFTSTGIELASRGNRISVLPVGITGESHGYLPPAACYAQGGYEVSCARWCPIACGETERLFDRIGQDVSAAVAGA